MKNPWIKQLIVILHEPIGLQAWPYLPYAGNTALPQSRSLMTIPARLHFVWIGTTIPWAYVFAVLSAVEHSELTEIVFHHTDILESGHELNAISNAPRVRVSRIDPYACLTQTGHELGLGEALVALYRRLEDPVMRSDVLRAAILYSCGGIYLDLDTVTVASLLPLTTLHHFVGSEVIVWPSFVRVSRSPALWARHLTLDVVRKVFRRMPNGWKAFRHIERFYTRGINNAVMGAEVNSCLFSDYLHAMILLSPERQAQRYALGPKLLQEVVDRYKNDDLTIHDPSVFYPLAPEISEHWFRVIRPVLLNTVLSSETRVVHWYASVRTRSLVTQITPAYVRENRGQQLYSALVCSCVSKLPEAA